MTERRAVVRTRVVVAAALLATVGLGCVFLVTLLVLLLGVLSSEGPSDMDVRTLLSSALIVPAIAWLMLAAAVTMHARLPLGRWLALAVALLLAVSPVVAIEHAAQPASMVDPIVLAHVFLIVGPVSWLPAVNLALGSLLAWAVITGWPRHPTPGPRPSVDLVAGPYAVRRPRSVTRLAATLGVIGVYALVPIVIRLTAAATSDEQGFAVMGPVRTGVLGLDCALIAGFVLLAAYALATRQRVALLITLPASAIGIAWAVLWGLALVSQVLQAVAPEDGGQPLAGLVFLATTLGLFAALTISALVVTVRQRVWFEPDAAAAQGPVGDQGRLSGRRWLAATTLAELAVVVAVLVVPARAGDGEEAALAPVLQADDVPQEVTYDGASYERIAWASLPASDLEPVDGVDVMSELEQPDQPPTAYALSDRSGGIIIALEPGAGSHESDNRRVGLYTAEEARQGPVDLPATICPAVDLTTVERGRCAAPERLVYDGHWYQRDVTLLVSDEQLAPTGVDARFDTIPGAYVPTAIALIADVDPAIAVALATPTGGLVYRSIGSIDRPVPELCNLARVPQDASSVCAG